MNKKDIAILAGCCAGVFLGGVLFGDGLRGIKEIKKKKDFNAAVATLMSVYKKGVHFSESDIAFLKRHGFDDSVMSQRYKGSFL